MSSEAKQNKKKISPKAQQIIDIVVTSLEAIVVVVCIIVSVLSWVGLSKPANRNINWFAIQTDSMMGDNKESMNPGDLMITKKVASINDLEKGDVIAYTKVESDTTGTPREVIVTHRIYEIDKEKNVITTKGDNTLAPDDKKIKFEDVLGKYVNHLDGVGKIVLWLGGYKKSDKTQTGKNIDPSLLGGYGYTNNPNDVEGAGNTSVFLIIIIPLALLFVYNGYIVAKWILDERAKKIRAAALAEAQAGQAESAESEAAIKRAALVEFMKSQGMTDEQIDAYFASQAPAVEPNAEQAPAEETPVQDAETDTQDKPEE